MTPERLAEIEARAKAATPQIRITRYPHGGARISADFRGEPDRILIADLFRENDREFYFNARADISDLIAAVREREALIEKLSEMLEKLPRLGLNEMRDTARAALAETQEMRKK